MSTIVISIVAASVFAFILLWSTAVIAAANNLKASRVSRVVRKNGITYLSAAAQIQGIYDYQKILDEMGTLNCQQLDTLERLCELRHIDPNEVLA